MRVLFRSNDDPLSRQRHVGEVTGTTGEGDEAVHTIEYEGQTYERLAISCLPAPPEEN